MPDGRHHQRGDLQHEDVEKVLPFHPLGYRESLLRAMTREEQDRIHTRWSDAYPPANGLAIKLRKVETTVRYRTATRSHREGPLRLSRSVSNIGGEKGWFYSNWLWRLRGAIDRILLGVGHSRGRRSSSSLRVNDVIDFWRVEDLQAGRAAAPPRRNETPGQGLAAIQHRPRRVRELLVRRGILPPRGLFGRAYWYMFLPFHVFIFRDLIQQIEKESGVATELNEWSLPS